MRAWLRRLSLTAKLVWISIAVSVLGVGAAGVVLTVRHEHQVEADTVDGLAVLSRAFAEQCAAPLIFDDPLGASRVLSRFEASSLVGGAAIYRANGERFATHLSHDASRGVSLPSRLDARAPRSAVRRTPSTLRFEEPIVLDGTRVGTLVVAASSRAIRERILGDVGSVVVVVLVAMLFSVTLAFALQRVLTRPVVELATAMRKVADGAELTERVVPPSEDEIGHLYRGYNTMLARLDMRTREVAEQRAHLEALVQTLPDPVFVVDEATGVVELYAKDDALLVRPPSEHVGRTLDELWPGEVASLVRAAVRAVEAGSDAERVTYELDVAKGRCSFDALVVPMRDAGPSGGGSLRVLVVARDVTERRNLEEQLLQAQKMEAVGQLAGGVAHDINNFLTPIVAYAEMMQRKPDREDIRTEGLRTIIDAAGRSRDLIQRLLAFGRRQVFELRPLDLAQELREIDRMLRALVREHIDIKLALPSTGVVVDADATQLQQVVVNLAVNAQDAMPSGGTLAIDLSTSVVAESDLAMLGAHATTGRFAVLSVSDSGTGMSPEVMRQAFEPFYTTKPRGKGTGLGLSTVYGVVQQHRGFLVLSSELGIGTTFRIYLPLAGEASAREDASNVAIESLRGTETVLLVEDNDAVCELTQKVLEDAGYTVLMARDGASALRLAASHRGDLDLLLTDVILPELDGREIQTRLRQRRPGLATLFVSGHSEEVLGAQRTLDADVRLLRKPYGVAQLLTAVRATLDETPKSVRPRPMTIGSA